MNKKTPSKNKTIPKTKDWNPDLESPEKTKKSLGSFWINPRDNGKWRVLFQNWHRGKRQTAKQISTAMYPEMGLTPDMSVKKAKEQIKKYNQFRKKNIGITSSQIKTLKRMDKIIAFDKAIFPSAMVEEFLKKLQESSDGEQRYKRRLVRNFEIVQEIAKSFDLMPHQYESDTHKIISHFKKQKYSISYSKDIIWVMNKWGLFYSRKTKTFFEPIGKIKIKTSLMMSLI